MKIVQFNAVYGSKSTGLIAKDIDNLLQSTGHNSYVFCAATSENKDNVITVGSSTENKIHALRTRLDGKQGYGSLHATANVIKKLNEIKPDILHLHNVHSNFLNLNLLVKYAKSCNIPIVLTLHDCWYFTGKCYHFFDIGCEKWKTGCYKCPKRKKDIPSYLLDSSTKVYNDRKALFDYDKLYVVGCSEWISNMARQSAVFEKAHISYIRNGIDIDIFNFSSTPFESRVEEEFKIVVMANKWFLPINKDITSELISNLKPNDRLIIIGCNEEQEQIYASNHNITTYGYVTSREKLAELYASGDVFLNLTDIDTLPTVNMEAIACGTPVITTDAGGSGELVENGKTGYVLKGREYMELNEKFEYIRQGKISKDACRKYAEEHFVKSKNYLKYLDLYQNINLMEEI